MGFFDRLKRPVIEPAAPEQPGHVPSYAATPELSLGWYRRDETGENGKAMIGLGWRLFDSNGVMIWNEDPECERAGVFMVLSVAGVSHRPGALDNPAFALGRRVVLVREPANQYDHNAVSVWDEAKTVQLGFLPRAIAATFAPLLDSGDGRAAMVVWEHRDTKGTRLGVNLLTAPPPVMDHLCRDLAPPETR
jgi:hypothetical protein